MKFVGGYYDKRIFEDEEGFYYGCTPFSNDIDIYTLEEVIKLPFVESVIEWYEDNKEDEEECWDDLTENKKAELIIEYVDTDDIAALVYFDDDIKAQQYKQQVLKEILEKERMSIFIGNRQDQYGNYNEVYMYKNNEENNLYNVLTINEASILYKKEVSTLRRVFASGINFQLGVDVRKSGATWLVTKEAMERVYNKK